MDIPPPEHGDDLIEWSLRFIETTMNFGPIHEVKKKNTTFHFNMSFLNVKILKNILRLPTPGKGCRRGNDRGSGRGGCRGHCQT